MALLEISGLKLVAHAQGRSVTVVESLDLGLAQGETSVLVGESGSGKSLTALAIVRLLPSAVELAEGSIKLGGRELSSLPEREMNSVRGARIGFVFQEPQAALNPVMGIGNQVGEVLVRHRGLRGRQLRERVVELLAAVGIPEPHRRLDDYPHQFSGGMKQRVMIAIALAAEPDLLIADEPTTALDVSTQAQILDLLRDEQRARGMAMLFITHDLAVAHRMADSLVVMKEGRVVEQGTRDAIFSAPRQNYTRHLFAVSPRLSSATLPAPRMTAGEPLLAVRELAVHFSQRGPRWWGRKRILAAVTEASLDVHAGETVAVVGESGSGKTTLGRALLRLQPADSGRVAFLGRDLFGLPPESLRRARRELQVVFQDPFASMNPRMTVQQIIEEGLVAQDLLLAPGARRAHVARLLEKVGLDPACATRFPHQFSGGQRQRISIARALAVEPRLIVCDEPTSALDVSVQAQILALLRSLQEERGLAYLFITHNLGVVAQLAHRVLVMHQGRIVESGPAREVLFHPRQDYTRALIAAVPSLP
ncbi:MAG: ABC transporter ATP-binding protein [Gammaproteobacteria bacterium]|nr:ABC transporter ATP-binding protein [Gammaproteobacteria bacterium]